MASELFGHEKGAFTGAAQRRLGRFELAEGVTIFLDEVGELPLDIQSALLRMQEREFERVGGTKVIRTNARVIAATNRDLQDAIDAGGFVTNVCITGSTYFRSRCRRCGNNGGHPNPRRVSDRPLCQQDGKEISGIGRATLDRLKAYPWPGNIRELQNLIKRSIIVCETENFTVDESWLSRKPHPAKSPLQLLVRAPASQEKKTIEAALAEAGGVFRSVGCRCEARIPASTWTRRSRHLNQQAPLQEC